MAVILSTTLASLRQGFLRSIGEYYSGTTTGVGNVGGTTFVDTTNRIEQDHKFSYWWSMLTSGSMSGQIRQSSDNTKSTKTVTVDSAFGAPTQVPASVTYEIMRWHPANVILPVLNVGLGLVFPVLGRDLIDDSLITSNVLPGSDEDWESASTLRWWALTGAGATLAQESTIRRQGRYSAKVTRVGTDCYIECSDTQWSGLLNLRGQTVVFEDLAYATVADRASISIYANGARIGAQAFHTGVAGWELLSTGSVTLPSTLNSISFRREVSTGNTSAYFTHRRVIGPPTNTYILPLVFQFSPPQAVAMQVSSYATGDERPCDDMMETQPFAPVNDYSIRYDDMIGSRVIRFGYQPPAGYTIRLFGREYMSLLSAETDTIPFEAPQTYLVYASAAAELYRQQQDKANAEYWDGQYSRLERRFGTYPPVPSMSFSREPW